MAISWGNITNGDVLSSIRTAINSFNNSVVTTVNSIETSILGINASLLTKASISSVEANTTSINSITDNLNTRQFAYSKVSSITVSGTTYEEIGRLTVSDLAADVYKLTLSMIFTLDSTTNSAFFRFSTDGGISWIEVRKEAKDIHDKMPEVYTTMLSLGAGTTTIIAEARKESAGDTLSVLDHNIMLEKKGSEAL